MHASYVLTALLSATAFSTGAFSRLLQCEQIVQISEATPNINTPTGNYGLVQRTAGKATSSLCTITYPAEAVGKKCRLTFQNPNTATGSRKAQVYTLGSPNYSTSTFNSRGAAYRDQLRGTLFNAAVGGIASWDSPPGPEFDCAVDAGTAGGKKGYELAPVGDEDLIRFYFPYGFKVEVVGLV
ncbi:hypothetical protein EDC01DRAFT_284001 [Geopyxis carbonaria]|nr:hypothetical protein EDC01DRAFT_284001 [Geopyxis carbonaria]